MSDVKYIRPRNWAKHQDFRHKRPSYIRNYIALLDDPDYGRLNGNQRAILHGLWILCGATGKGLPYDCGWIAGRLSLNTQAIARGLPVLMRYNFIELCDVDWKAYSNHSRVKVAPETETETETETEDRSNERSRNGGGFSDGLAQQQYENLAAKASELGCISEFERFVCAGAALSEAEALLVAAERAHNPAAYVEGAIKRRCGA